MVKRHFRNNGIWVKFIPGKLSLKSSNGFFPSFPAGRLLKPTNTMSVDVNALYFTHTSQCQHMLKKSRATKNWDNLSSELTFGLFRVGWGFSMKSFRMFILNILQIFTSIMILLCLGGRIQKYLEV